MLSGLCLVGGCKDDDDKPVTDSVYLYTTSQTVADEAGSCSVTIFATCAWDAAADDWIALEPLSGGEKGIYVVKLAFDENFTAEERSGSVVFKAGSYTETFTLTQESN